MGRKGGKFWKIVEKIFLIFIRKTVSSEEKKEPNSSIIFPSVFWTQNIIASRPNSSLRSTMDVMIHSSSFLLPELPADQTSGAGPTYALVLLNQHLPRFTPLLWKHGNFLNPLSICFGFLFGIFILIKIICTVIKLSVIQIVDNKVYAAQLRVCADGGANRLYNELPGLFPDEDASSVRNRFVFSQVDLYQMNCLRFWYIWGL